MVEDILKVENLSHRFGDFLAVDKINFTVEKGKIFSFLGPNGAGKTTTINVLISLLPIQDGKVTVAGYDVKTQQDEVRKSIGIVFQEETLDKDLTVWELLEFHGRIYSIPKDIRRERIDELLKVVELTSKRDELVKNLSGGMRRRLEIARGLLTRPKVLFLDEPTIGLDPQTRYNIWDYIKKVNKEGITIFLTTHYMDEADQLSDIINIIDNGKIIAKGTTESLKDAIGKDMIYLETDSDEVTERICNELKEIKEVKISSKGLIISLNIEGSQFLPRLIKKIETEGIEITSINLKKPTLDDVFIHFTGKEFREKEQEKKILVEDKKKKNTIMKRRNN
ncbi:ATP-binding cassette domain-containing protein [Thermoplasmatota archaeon]